LPFRYHHPRQLVIDPTGRLPLSDHTRRRFPGTLGASVIPGWFNGIRLSPHVFNTEANIDKALQALRSELALA
jgi:selenocysteine lyase/cysteine desulfurase